MTTHLPTTLDPVAAAWLAGGLPRAVDALLVARLEAGRIRGVGGSVADRGLDRQDRFDAVLLDALGARRSRDVETVRFRLLRDRRLEVLRTGLRTEGLLTGRTALGLPDRLDRPARTAAGRRLLRDLRAAPPPGAVWEVALHGRDALTDLALRTALEPPPRPEPPRPPRRLLRWQDPQTTEAARYAAGGAAVAGFSGWGGDGGGWGGDGGGGGGDGGGC